MITVASPIGGGCFTNAPSVESGSATAVSQGSDGGSSEAGGTSGSMTSAGESAGTDGSSGGISTDDPSASGATAHADSSGGDPDTSGGEASGDTGSTGEVTTADEGSSGSTGSPFDVSCLDGDLGSAVGLGVAEGNTNGADDSYSPTCVGGDSPDAMLLWTAPADGTYAFSTIGSGFDTGLAALSGDCDGIEIACNDDSSQAIVQSDVTIALEQGQTIVLVIDGYNGASGAYSLTISSL